MGRDRELQLSLKFCRRLLGTGVTVPWPEVTLGDGAVGEGSWTGCFLEEERGDQALAGVRMSLWHLLRAWCPRLARSKPPRMTLSRGVMSVAHAGVLSYINNTIS